MFSEIKHIFFDLDDTLWDFEKNSKETLQELFAEYTLHEKLGTDFENFHQTYKKVNANLWERYSRKEISKHELRYLRFDTTFSVFSHGFPDERVQLADQYVERAPAKKNLKEGCLEVLHYLQSKNYRLHIITNGFAEIQDLKISGSGLKPFFSQVIVSETFKLSKPDPAIFRLAEELAHAQKEECLMVGDNFDNDIRGAANAGWRSIYFHPEANEHTPVKISKLAQMMHLL